MKSAKNQIEELVNILKMNAHQEGGFYAETYRADSKGETENGQRQLAMSIFFLLRSEDVSHPHRIKSDDRNFLQARRTRSRSPFQPYNAQKDIFS